MRLLSTSCFIAYPRLFSFHISSSFRDYSLNRVYFDDSHGQNVEHGRKWMILLISRLTSACWPAPLQLVCLFPRDITVLPFSHSHLLFWQMGNICPAFIGRHGRIYLWLWIYSGTTYCLSLRTILRLESKVSYQEGLDDDISRSNVLNAPLFRKYVVPHQMAEVCGRFCDWQAKAAIKGGWLTRPLALRLVMYMLHDSFIILYLYIIISILLYLYLFLTHDPFS